MRNWMLLLLTMTASGAVPSRLGGQQQASGTTEQQLTDLYRRLLTADAMHDTTGFAQVLAPTYRFITPRGDTILTRTDRIANAAKDTSRRNPPTLRGCEFQVYEPSAVGQCRYTTSARSAAGDSTVNFVSLVVFSRLDGRWLIVASHPSPVRAK